MAGESDASAAATVAEEQGDLEYVGDINMENVVANVGNADETIGNVVAIMDNVAANMDRVCVTLNSDVRCQCGNGTRCCNRS